MDCTHGQVQSLVPGPEPTFGLFLPISGPWNMQNHSPCQWIKLDLGCFQCRPPVWKTIIWPEVLHISLIMPISKVVNLETLLLLSQNDGSAEFRRP